MNLTPETVALVRRAIDIELARYGGQKIIGYSCLARGADSIFADAILSAGGSLVVILPSQDYCLEKVKPDHRSLFDDLLTRAKEVVVLPHDHADRTAYAAANDLLLNSVDGLFAVWDGAGDAAQGGTAQCVAEAGARSIETTIIWPNGATRG